MDEATTAHIEPTPAKQPLAPAQVRDHGARGAQRARAPFQSLSASATEQRLRRHVQLGAMGVREAAAGDLGVDAVVEEEALAVRLVQAPAPVQLLGV
jgi:hypothetical protein